MLGYMLARAGIDVTVLEKWPDFFRDFRGDTIHPSTMDVLHELGLLEKFLKLPHNETRKLKAYVGNDEITLVDLTHLNTICKFVAFIPQWDFLNFITAEAKKYPTFHLLMETEVVDLIKENGKVAGVLAKSKDATFEIKAELVIGADGRHSTIREKAQMEVEDLGVPIDVLWFRLSRKSSDPSTSLGWVNFGKFMVMIDRDDYWQCGFVIQKGAFEKWKQKGLENFRADIAQLTPFLVDRVEEIKNWEQIKLLSVTVDHLKSWSKENLLLIGDAAHAMSPIGGVGINFAIQDAIATANILIPKMLHGRASIEDLQAIQRRREKPTRKMQKLQLYIQDHVIANVLKKERPIKLPWYLKLLLSIPTVNRIPARIIGVGFLAEHVDPGLFSKV